MPLHRHSLPQLSSGLFLTDGGIETYLIFHRGVELPLFATFTLHRQEAGRRELIGYFEKYLEIARERDMGLVLETATWRANPDWGDRAGHSQAELDGINEDAVNLLVELRSNRLATQPPIVISGNIGPRGDGYSPESLMSPEESRRYHSRQVSVFAGSEADLVTGLTMTHAGEASGIALAAREAGIPAVISFTVETDGCLPTGDTLEEAIRAVDLATEGYPCYYMINCAHPTHFVGRLPRDPEIACRVGGIRANASRLSHAELDAADSLDEGNPGELAGEYRELLSLLPDLKVIGGCCGTDHRHIAVMVEACLAGQS